MEYTNRYDVIVAGGGFAGCAAAISAAEQGMSVLLIEASGALGGAANVNLVNPFMRFFSKGEERVVFSRGIFERITRELEAMGGFRGGKSVFESRVFDEEKLKRVLDRMLTKAGAKLLFHAFLCGAEREGERIVSVTAATKAGLLRFYADCFVDATGDADLAALAGCPFRLGREKDGLCQPMTLCFRVGNVDMERFTEERPLINPLYARWREEGRLQNPREDVLIFKTVSTGVLHFNSTRIVRLNPTNPFDVTQAELEAREQVFELLDFLRENFESFRHCDLLTTAASIGVRESRMIDGTYVLTGEDLKACRCFEDSIALGNYDIDIHNPEGSGTSHYYFEGTDHYTIPYRALVPKNCENLLVAGRCVSVTHEAQASIRIMPIVCCLGEAAGTAAAMAVRDSVPVSMVDTDELRRRLTEAGAVV